MSLKILIVEDELLIARNLKLILEQAGHVVTGIAPSVQKSLDHIMGNEPEMVLLDIQLKGESTGIDLAHKLNEMSIPFVYLSANSNQKILELAKRTKPYGFMIKPFREEEVLIAIDIARYRHSNSMEAEFRKKQLLSAELDQLSFSENSNQEQLQALCAALQPHLPFDFLEVGEIGHGGTGAHWKGFQRIGYREYRELDKIALMDISGMSSVELSVLSEETKTQGFTQVSAITEGLQNPVKQLYAELFGLKSSLGLSSSGDDEVPICFYSKDANAYQPKHKELLNALRKQIVKTLIKINSGHSTGLAAGGSASRGIQPRPAEKVFEGIIGHSHALMSVLDMVRQVSIVDTSVLILGETGTGKEQIARQIHLQSSRREMPMIKVNCAALPLTLIESELFGHEKGAFTGAVSRKAGKFELAQNGTLFLDEIGEIPMEMQVKLLRVLQEKEIDRLGGNAPVKINVRIIAATNKNLEKEVAEGRFRMDLYYRLNVFPVQLPSLRERREDIPELCRHFTSLYARLHAKKVSGITADCIQQMMDYSWPGNIRELENVIERSLVLCTGETISKVYLPNTYGPGEESKIQQEGTKSMEDIQRAHIQAVLGKCNHRIYGAGGAAEMLGMPATTLNSKIKKLGIARKYRNS